MAKYKTKKIEDKMRWEKFVLGNDPKSFLQSWNWGETNKLAGDDVKRVGFFNKEKLVGGCQLIGQKARRGPHILVPGGPVLDWKNKELVDLFLKAIRKIAKEKKAWFVRVRPELLKNKRNKNLFSELGFIPSPMHLHAENTWVLDITGSEEDILYGMRKNTRYMVRKSLKAGLKLERSIDTKDVDILHRLQLQTAKRHDFVGFPKKIFTGQIETFGKDNQAMLYIIKKDKEPLVAAIIIFYGDTAYYHHSASSKKARDVPASYFLQWKVIQDAKKKGLKFYNFWGIAPKNAPKNHRFKGVTIFKKGFGGERVDWLPAHDLRTSNLYWATYLFETGRRFMRGL